MHAAKSLQSCPTLCDPIDSRDSPGKNTGVGCHFLLQCMKVKSESEVAQSCPTLINPVDCSPPGSSIHGVFQARVLEWGAIAFSGIMHGQWANARFCNTEWRELWTYTFRYFWIRLKTRALQIFNFYRNAYSFILWQFDILTLFLERPSTGCLHLLTSGFTNRLITLQRVPCGM